VGWLPRHMTLRHDGRLVAALPVYVKGNSEGEFVFDWSWADFAERSGIAYYPKIVVAVPFTPASGDRVLVTPDEDRAAVISVVADAARAWCGKAGASGVHVLFPRDAEASAWEAAGYLRRDGFQYHWFRHGARTFDDYLARFTSKQRNQIKRELRGVTEAGIVVETLEPGAHSGDIAQAMYSFYESTIDKHGMWGRHYLTRAFFDAVIDRYRDRLAWVVAREGASGRLVGGAFNVTRGTRLYGRYWGSAVDVPYLHFVVCYYAGIRFAIERGLDVFEPGAGGEHKRARGFVPTLTHSAHWLRDGRFRRALGPWLAHERERVRGLVESGGDGD
ncbi:MAG TPA: GNAT family N-acetyltransferase, partial [Polyangiaceae bacterium]|nr:GNAT family N-acetyltransferase [Polyangiaceae bacterium]